MARAKLGLRFINSLGDKSRLKKVLLIVIDALSARHVNAAFDSGQLPNMLRLAERGELHDECISIFPSITPAATASIITGRYPCDHGIAGAFFYNTAEDRVNYFGDDLWAIIRKGFGEFFNDFLVRLNGEVLASETLFQRVERAGRKAASLNYLIMRGEKEHTVDVPWLLRLFSGVPWQEKILGPDLLCLGDFVAGSPRENRHELSAPGGPFGRFGFQDESTGAFLLELAERNAWRDLTVAYFPDNDFDSHDEGPTSALSMLRKVDDHLGELFEVCGGIDALLADTTVLITGDHAQSDLVADKKARAIIVDDLLDEFSVVPAGEKWTSHHELMVCPNMRACQIYLRRGLWPDLPRIVGRALSDPHVDQAIWRTESQDGGHCFHVATRDRGELRFWRARPDAARGRDVFGNSWDWAGSLAPVTGETSSSGQLGFADYPNALERIATSFAKPAGGDLWLTAHVGHEFKLPDTALHNAGSHGSLHKFDSASPMIFAGAPAGISLPADLRTIDTADLCLRILGITGQQAEVAGAAR